MENNPVMFESTNQKIVDPRKSGASSSRLNDEIRAKGEAMGTGT
jgi:hypothetical protein